VHNTFDDSVRFFPHMRPRHRLEGNLKCGLELRTQAPAEARLCARLVSFPVLSRALHGPRLVSPMMQGSALPCTLLTSTSHAVCHRPNVAQATLTRCAAAPSLPRRAVRLNTERKSVTQRRRRSHVLAPSRVRPVARLAQSPHVPPVAVSGLTLAGVMLTVMWTCVPAVRSLGASLAVVLAVHWTVFVPIAAPFAVALLYRVWTHGDKLIALQTDEAEREQRLTKDAAEREQRLTKDAAEREQRLTKDATEREQRLTDLMKGTQADAAVLRAEMKVDAAEREQRLTDLIKGTQADAAEREQRLTDLIKGTQADAAEREQRMERSVTQWVEHTTYAVSAHASSARTAAEAATAAAQNAQAAAVAAQAAAAAAQAPSSTT
jgi:hypothetical protein